MSLSSNPVKFVVMVLQVYVLLWFWRELCKTFAVTLLSVWRNGDEFWLEDGLKAPENKGHRGANFPTLKQIINFMAV